MIVILALILLTGFTVQAEETQRVNPDLKITVDCRNLRVSSNPQDTVSLFGISIEDAFHDAVASAELMTIMPSPDEIYTAIGIDLTEYNLDISTEENYNRVVSLLYDLAYQSLEYFYLSNTMYPYVENDVVTALFFLVEPSFTGNGTLKEQQSTLNTYIYNYDMQCVKILAENLYPEMSQLEIAIALHSYLGDKVYYDASYDKLSFSPYSAIMNGKAVCQGYAFAYKHLLKMMGIDGKIAVSDKMDHAWNVVNIDGQWYNTDVTWDDNKTYGVTHRYFLLSDETLKKRDHYDWNSPVQCTSQKYETGYFFNVSDPNIVYTSDFMTCRYSSDGYFLYSTGNKYYKATTDGSPTEINKAEFMYDLDFAAKTSTPFTYSDERFAFVEEKAANAITLLTNLGTKNICGKLITVLGTDNKINTVSISQNIELKPGEYAFCKLNLTENCDKIRIFFWGDGLHPLSKGI